MFFGRSESGYLSKLRAVGMPESFLEQVRDGRFSEILEGDDLEDPLRNLEVRKALAQDMNTPDELLSKLTQDPVWYVRRAAFSSVKSSYVGNRLSLETDWRVVEGAIRHNSHISSVALDELASHEVSNVRYRVANHANVQTKTLYRLAHDPDEIVASEARARLGCMYRNEIAQDVAQIIKRNQLL